MIVNCECIPAAAVAGNLRADIQNFIGNLICLKRGCVLRKAQAARRHVEPQNCWMQIFWFCWDLSRVRLPQAGALGCATKPRDGVGDQIGYLGLRVAPSSPAVNPASVNKQRKRSLFRFLQPVALALRTDYHMGFLVFRVLRGLYVSFFSRSASIFRRFALPTPVHTFGPQPPQSESSPAKRAALLFLLPLAVLLSACGGGGSNSGGGNQQNSAPVASLSTTSPTPSTAS